ncbi:MAG TPA: arsenate reductase ArsC [Gammaproteobacteria bacterium]
MASRVFNVLILCTGNSARSIIAEALVNHWGQGKFRAFSAGSMPTGKVNPYALDVLERMRIPVKEPRSKSWDEFAKPGAPVMDFIFTVCDNAAGEVCPVWPGKPMIAHWGVADPATVTGDEAEKINAFQTAFRELENRIKIFANLPIQKLDKVKLQKQLHDIGKTRLGED